MIYGKDALLLIGIQDSLSYKEKAEYESLLNASYGDTSTQEKFDQAEKQYKKNVLRLKQLDIKKALSKPNIFKRVPILISEELFNAGIVSANSMMDKPVTTNNNIVTTSQAYNKVVITIAASKEDKKKALFLDLLIGMMDIIYSKSDVSPSVSYFGFGDIVLNGYITRYSKPEKKDSSLTNIVIEIQKDFSFLYPNDKFGVIPNPVNSSKTLSIDVVSGAVTGL